MSSKYFDFVLCEPYDGEEKYLYRAPAWSGIAKGDDVLVETSTGSKQAQVCAIVTLSEEDKETIDMIMQASGASKDLRKVLTRVRYIDIEYKEDEKDE